MLSIRVFYRALGRASRRTWIFKARHVFFLRQRWMCSTTGAKKGVVLMKFIMNECNGILLSALVLICSGCFSSMRYVADVRPELVAPASNVKGCYRIARVMLKESEFIKEVRMCMEKGWIGNVNGAISYNQYCKQMKREDAYPLFAWPCIEKADIAELEARHKEDTKIIQDLLSESLVRLYPNVFSNDPNAVPLTVFVSWDAKYNVKVPFCYPNIASICWPLSADLETKYNVNVLLGEIKGNDGFCAGSGVSAIRSSEVWETMLFPIGSIPIIGESNWPKSMGFCDKKGSFSLNRSEGLNSKDCVRQIVFDPDVDPEVLAALVVKALNQQTK